MKKQYRFIAFLIAALLVLCSCGGSKSSASRNTAAPSYAGDYESYNMAVDDGAFYAPAAEESAAPGKNASQSKSAQTGSNSAVYNSKVIHRASLSLQTTEFDATRGIIEGMTEQMGGYIENVQVNNGNSYRSTSYKSASFTIRVPREKFQDFLTGINEECHVVSMSQSAEDVGEQYFNTEQRLETLNNKHERLEELLKKAENMTDIIELENALSECEYQINLYKTTLNRYDSLIGFATINLDLREVARPAEGIDENPGFFARLGRSFSEGFERFLEGADDFVMWISYNILTLIILIVIIVVLIKVKPFRKIRERRAVRREAKAAKKNAKAESPAEELKDDGGQA